jgi:hypothetical protein
MDENRKLIEVKRRVRAIKGFYIHWSVFVMVMAMLTAINLASAASWWVQWPFMGWGVGLLAHAFLVYCPVAWLDVRRGWLGPRWEQRKIKQLMAKE